MSVPTPVRTLAVRSLPSILLARRRLRGRALIATFHRVNDVHAGDGLTLSSDQFRAYVRFFAQRFQLVSLDEIVDRLQRGEPFDRHVAITFDDGYRDNFEVAAPILESLGAPATFFVTTGFLDTDRVAPWDAELDPAPGWMSWAQVESLHRRGFTIGGHTADHADLGRVELSEAMDQLAACRDAIEKRVGTRPRHFAYPFGGVGNITKETRECVREAGFESCASCFGGLVERSLDPMRLPRVAITSWHAAPRHFAFDLGFDRL